MTTEFEKGILYSAGIIDATHDVSTIARNLLEQAGLHDADCSEMDEYDKGNLRVLAQKEWLELRGLTASATN